MRNRQILRLKPIIALLLNFAVILSFAGCKKDDLSTERTSMVVVDANDAIAQLAKVEEDYGYGNALSELTEKSTFTLDGDSYYRLQQNYQGIPVYGRTVVCATDEDGNVTSLTGNIEDITTSPDLTPSITLEQVNTSILSYLVDVLGSNVDDLDIHGLDEENLCIFVETGTGTTHLAYCINAESYEFVVNAHNGNILSASPTLFEDNDEILLGYKGSDTAQENGFPIEKLEEYYIMSDPSRGLTVYTFNYRSSGNGSGIDHSQAFLVESTDNVFGNTEEETTPILDTVRLYYNDAYDNGENARGGVANGAGVVSVGWDTGVECVDTIAHEYTHFVSRNIVNWNGNDETGAMNEAMSERIH